jgi:hypothetical protein
MAAIHSLDIEIGLKHLEIVNTLGRSGPVRRNLNGNRPFSKRITNGTSTGQIDLGYFRDTPTAIAASGNQDFDLAGSLTDSFGTTITMAKICGILVLNWNTAGTLTLKIPAANGLTTVFLAASDGIIIGKAADDDHPGIFFLWHPLGAAVTAGTVDLLNLLNNDSSNAADYTIGLFGRTA